MLYSKENELPKDKSVSNIPLKIALIYSLFGYSWIIITDAIVFDPKTFAFNIVFQLSILKGIVFVLLTSLIIYYLLHKGISILVKEREEFRNKEEMYRRFLDNINGVAVQMDRNLKPIFLHGNFENITGYSLNELFTNESVWENLLPEEEKTRFYETINRMLTESSLEVEGDYQLVRKDGKRVWVKGFLRNICDEYGKPQYIQALYFDITKMKEVEEKLQEYTRNLEKILEERTRQLRESEKLAAIGEATMMVGHDLRNPLQAIINNVYIIKSKCLDKLPKKARSILEREGLEEILKRIENEINYMNKIVRDLQDYSKPITPKYGRIHLTQMIERILSQVVPPEKIVVRKNIYVEEIVCDEMLLERVLYNIILNAVQAMPEGGTLTITGEKSDGNIILSVEDTGVGIPENILPKLFTPFFTTKAKGQGLGLAICKRFIEVLNGKIDVASEVGKGSKFTIAIPLSTQTKTIQNP